MIGPTYKQEDIMIELRRFWKVHERGPTYSEIASKMCITGKAIEQRYKYLVKKGMIELRPIKRVGGGDNSAAKGGGPRLTEKGEEWLSKHSR